jgi:hypothetical protein
MDQIRLEHTAQVLHCSALGPVIHVVGLILLVSLFVPRSESYLLCLAMEETKFMFSLL